MAEIIIESPKKSKKWLWILMIILIIIIAAGAIYYFWSASKIIEEKNPDNTQVVIGGGLPEGFPSGLPIESGAILQSQETKFEGGVVQSVSYASGQSLRKMFTEYSAYISANDWIVVNKQEEGDNYFIFATKDSTSLNISISQEMEGQIFVIIAYTKVQ
jgi:flagellar basal body-associated protein FliL